MWPQSILDLAIAQLLAFVAFLVYPALQYISLKRFAKNEGQPELWYLPDYGFRLVARNISGNKVLSEIKYTAWLRRIVPSSAGSSVATSYDDRLFGPDELFFIFPGSDLTLVGFRLELIDGQVNLVFIDMMGRDKRSTPLSSFDRLVSDYSANVENFLNFDIKIAKRIEIDSKSLHSAYLSVRDQNIERSFPIDRIRDVG